MIEPMSDNLIALLNRTAARLLRREASLTPGGLPPLLQLARWGLDNLDLTGPWAREREAMAALLLSLERSARRVPVAAARRLAEGVDPAAALQPGQLGPTLEDAASLVVEQLYYLVAQPTPD